MIKDFDGTQLKINKTGWRYPVDAELKEENNENILYISAKVKFLDVTMYEYENMDLWRKSVLDGFREWSGEYMVFDNQSLKVQVNVEETDKITDSIYVMCVDDEMSTELQNTYDKLNMENLEQVFQQNRSFANSGILGLGWKTYVPRLIYMMPHTLQDFDAARITAKHEFGHVLGIGDLYRDIDSGLYGVPGGAFEDISKYYIGNSYYDMVMCNNGPVRNNDIEMALLAFHTGKFQNYQKKNKKDKISDALGKGN